MSGNFKAHLSPCFLQGMWNKDGCFQISAENLWPLSHAKHRSLGLHVGLGHEETLGDLNRKTMRYKTEAAKYFKLQWGSEYRTPKSLTFTNMWYGKYMLRVSLVFHTIVPLDWSQKCYTKNLDLTSRIVMRGIDEEITLKLSSRALDLDWSEVATFSHYFTFKSSNNIPLMNYEWNAWVYKIS